MPISLRVPLKRLSQREFGELSFAVMREVFAIYDEIGRFFDESVYKLELANRMPMVRLEEPIDVQFGTFRTRLLLDVLVDEGGVFEFKAVETISGRHRAQLMQYLMLCGLAHGKLINVRPERIQHEFVNSHSNYQERIQFEIDSSRWQPALSNLNRFQEVLIDMLRDIGTGLGLTLYEEAIACVLSDFVRLASDVPVIIGGNQLNTQRFHLLAPRIAFKLTGFDTPPATFEIHARRLLAHTALDAIAWVNIGLKYVTFVTIEK